MSRRLLSLFLSLAMLLSFLPAAATAAAEAPASAPARFAPDPYDLMPGDYYSFAQPVSETLHLLQPDGSMIEARLNPLEVGGTVETADGYTVTKNEDGWWTYAELGDGILSPAGQLVASDLVVGKDAPQGLAKKLGAHPSIFADANGEDTRDAMFDAIRATSSPNASIFTEDATEPQIWRYAIILVEFQDVKFQPHQTPEWFQERLSGLGTSPTGTVTDLYHENSHGRFIPYLDVYGPYTSDYDLAWYDNQITGRSVGWMINNDIGPKMAGDIDWEQYDNDKVVFSSGGLQFRSVDMVAVIQAGPGKEATGTPGHIWSHATTANYRTGQYGDDGRELRIRATNINPAIGFNIGVVAHEMGHSIGEADYYATNYLSAGTGDWDIMAGGSWLGNDPAGSNPAHFNPFIKIRQGWIEPTIITESTYGIELRPRSTNPDLIEIRLGGSGTGANNADERIFIEYVSNQVPGAIFDKAVPGSGILIWHYDAGGSQNNASRYRLAVQEYDFRDGTQELRLNLNRGEPTDPWFDTEIGMTPYTTPNTNRNTPLNGSRQTGWSIINISPLGPTMTLDIVRGDDAGRVTADRPGLTRQPVIVGDGPADLRATVRNTSGAALNGVTVQFWATVGSESVLLAEATANLPNAAATTVTATWAEPFAGKYQVEARVVGLGDIPTVSEAGTIRIFERPARVLVVDDDDGYGSEEAFEGVLTSLGVPYVLVTGTADLATMRQYDLIIWSAGQSGRQAGQLNAREIADLKAYLNGGGKLWMTSPRLAAALGATGSAPGVDPAMLRDYFGASYPMSSQRSGGTITGQGHAIGGNATIAIRPYPGREIQDFLRPAQSRIGTVEPLFAWSLGDYLGFEVTGSEAYGNFRVVYFGFNLSQVIDGADRLLLTQQVLDRMGIATAYFDQQTYLMQMAGAVHITVRDAAAEGDSITVTVTSQRDPEGVNVTLEQEAPGIYKGTVTLQKNNSRGNALRVNDRDEIRVTYGDLIWGAARVLARVDQDMPATLHHDRIFNATEYADLPMIAVVTDDIRVQRVDLYYRVAGTQSYTRVRMEQSAPHAYMATIPGAMISARAVEYYITATDSKGNVTSHGTADAPWFITVQPRHINQ